MPVVLRVRSLLRALRCPSLVPCLVLGAGIVVSLLAAAAWRAEVRSNAEESFRQRAGIAGMDVTTALRRMDDLTTAVRTLVETTPGLTNGELAAWYRAMGAERRYTGVDGVGYVVRVPRSGLRRYEALLRRDPVPGLAVPPGRLRIVPAGVRASYCLVRLGVSHGLPRLLEGGAGFDYCAAPGLGSLLRAGRPTAFAAALPGAGQVVVFALPVGAGGAPAVGRVGPSHPTGFVLGVFDVRAVLGAAIAPDPDLAVSVARTRGLPRPRPSRPASVRRYGTLVPAATVGRSPAAGAFTARLEVEAGGRWTVTVADRPGWGLFSPDVQGAGVAAGGIGAAVLVAFLLGTLSRSRGRALRLAAETADELRLLALHDPLTGLPNRTLILDRAERLVARSRRRQGGVAALFLDLDDFKVVNDHFGHTAGDQILQAVADRLKAAMRGADTVGRLGGDEFVVLLEGDLRAARPETVARRLLEVLAAPFRIDALGERALSLSASIGIAAGERRSAGDLLRDADIALYQAKGAGKHRYATFREEMHASVRERLALEVDLQGALERSEFFLLYQPLLALACATPTGAEALLRWRHPTRGVLGPSAFVPIAERTGLIEPIGDWVLATACAQAREWHDRGLPLDVAVNVSAVQLERPGFTRTVRAVLEATGLPPASLVLELTETALMREPEVVARRLAWLKATGVRIAIDDFGTGLSSLASLLKLPLDILKIDGSFVSEIARSSASRRVVRTIVELARSMELETVAEGIEDEAQLALLEQHGCDRGQGFLLARPLEPRELAAFVSARAGRARPRPGSRSAA
jgi:diguanylate cyclase (GGDEF)-like protein